VATTTLKRGTRVQSRRTFTVKEIIGFTTKPDGVKRARLQDIDTGRITASRPDNVLKNHSIL
jgi:hypothetical protein